MSDYILVKEFPEWPFRASFDEDVISQTRKFFLLSMKNVGETLFIITFDDCVFAAGNNEWGQMGSGDLLRFHHEELKPLRHKKVEEIVFTCMGYCCARMRSGEVWSWGGYSYLEDDDTDDMDVIDDSYSRPKRISNLPSIVTLRAGQHAIIALAHDGSVWLLEWQDIEEYLLPVQRINLPAGEFAVAIQAGAKFYWAITESGRCFYLRKELQCNELILRWPIREISLPDSNDRFKSIASNSKYSVFITVSGRVYISRFSVALDSFNNLELLSSLLDNSGPRFNRALWLDFNRSKEDEEDENRSLRNREREDSTLLLVDENNACWRSEHTYPVRGEHPVTIREEWRTNYQLFNDLVLDWEPKNITFLKFACTYRTRCETLLKMTQKLIVKRPITIENCLEIFQTAKTLNWASLKYSLVNFIHQNRKALVRYVKRRSPGEIAQLETFISEEKDIRNIIFWGEL